MELFRALCSISLLLLLSNNGGQSLELAPVLDQLAVLGTNSITFTCQYTKLDSEAILFIALEKKVNETNYATMVTFLTSTNRTIYDLNSPVNITSRTLASLVDSQYPQLQYSSINCKDKGNYQWNVNYIINAVAQKTSRFTVLVKAPTTFTTDSSLDIAPSSVVNNGFITAVEGQQLNFTCSGDVGNEPAGQLLWYSYRNNATSGGIPLSSMAVPTSPIDNPNRPCSMWRSSVLTLTMTKNHNGVTIRCTVNQEIRTEFGEGYKQTNFMTILYGPDVPTVSSLPPRTAFTVGDNVTLMCQTDANPVASYYWELPDNSTLLGEQLDLTDLTEDQTGEYVCVAYNQIKGQNFTKTTSISFTVTKTTTTTTTTTTSTTVSPTEPGGNASSQMNEDDEDKKNTIIIAVCVVVGVGIIIAIIIIVICIKKRRKNVEEPIKVKNNQGLSYSGRPDLVSADYGKNNAPNMNASFNNSFDSSSENKFKNEDGLRQYIDLGFEDKPRSRRPIQLYDNMAATDSYSDITMPRV